MPPDCAARLRPDRRRVRHRDSGQNLPSLEIDADVFEVRATADGVRLDSRRHRQGLRGGPGGAAARGMGPRPRLRARRLQLRCRPGAAGGRRRLAADLERSPRARRAFSAGSRCARPRSAHRASGRATTSWIRGPAPRSAGGWPRGWRCRGRCGGHPPPRTPAGAAPRAGCGRGRADHGVHAADPRLHRGPVRAQSRPRGLGASRWRIPGRRTCFTRRSGAAEGAAILPRATTAGED